MADWRRKYPHFAAANDYMQGVVSKQIPACLFVRQACERQLTDLETDGLPFTFDLGRAEAICSFLEQLPHIKGVWAKRGELIHLEDWQCFKLTTPFGWVYTEDIHNDEGDLVAREGTRRFRTVYLEEPRKQAKSTIAAGVGLYMMSEDGEPGAEVYTAATTRQQARICFDVARRMAIRSSTLGIGVRAHSLFHDESGSLFQPLHAQGETLDGLNVAAALNDELHAWKKRSVYDVIETATGAREQPLMFNITTAGDNLEGICFDLRAYLVRVLSGAVRDDAFFGVIWTIDEDDRDHWMEPEVWRKANPNYGVSVYPMDMQALAKKAIELPSQQNAFLTKRLNVWVNASVAWMDMMRWQQGFDPHMKIEDFAGEECWLGVDLSSKIDVTSMAIVFRRVIDGKPHYYVFMRHWLPEAAVSKDRYGQYDGWVRMGAMRTTPGNVIDVDQIERETLAIERTHRISELAVDPGHNSTQYGVHMAQSGITTIDIRPTTANFSEPMKWVEAWVTDGVLHHNCPVLTWMISNVVARTNDVDNMFPKKETATRKIDGAIALLMAVNRVKAAESDFDVYGERELVVI
jgi:phage terminase large subunit-like protein